MTSKKLFLLRKQVSSNFFIGHVLVDRSTKGYERIPILIYCEQGETYPIVKTKNMFTIAIVFRDKRVL